MTVQHCSQWHYVTIRPSTYHQFFSLWFCSSESEKEPIKVTISDDACFRFILLKILLYRSSMSRVLNCGMILDTIWEWKCGFQPHFRVKPCFVSVWFYFVSSFQAILNGHIERSHADPISSLDNSSTGPSIRIETFETEISVRPTLVWICYAGKI